jgi:hypothetical protein
MNDSTLTKLFPADRIREKIQAGIQSLKPEVDAPRRTPHGSHAWSLPSQNLTLRQPQDGALTDASQIAGMGDVSQPRTKIVRSAGTSLREPEDAHLSGTMRSLARRVLGLNVTAQKNVPAFKQPEPYFAESHVMKSMRRDTQSTRKGPDATRSTDMVRTNRPQVA